MRSELNFNHLEIFFTLAKTKNFTETAKLLGIAQPAVSKQIKLLEEQYEQTLFIRSRNSIELTSKGEELYQRTYPLFKSITSEVDDIFKEADELTGTIRLASIPLAGEKLFIPRSLDFKQRNPKIKLEIELSKNSEIISKIRKGELDFGIVSELPDQENIRAYEIFTDEVAMVTTNKNTTRLISGTKIPFVLYRKQITMFKNFVKENFPKISLGNVTIEVVVNSHQGMIDTIKKLGCYGILPVVSIEKELSTGEFRIIGNKIKSKLYLIHSNVDYMEKSLLEFKKHLLTP